MKIDVKTFEPIHPDMCLQCAENNGAYDTKTTHRDIATLGRCPYCRGIFTTLYSWTCFAWQNPIVNKCARQARLRYNKSKKGAGAIERALQNL